MTANKLEKYAKLLIEVGVNLQDGQDLVLSCPVELAYFARLCAKAAYARGCREVVMNWSDDELTRLRFLNAKEDVFDEVVPFRKRFEDDYAAKGAAYLYIMSTDPENLKDVDPERIKRAQLASSLTRKAYRDRSQANELQWCIGSAPTAKWAMKVFPGKSAEEAVELLWDAILTTVRVDEDNDPVALWKAHVEKTDERAAKLNGYNFEYLLYKNSLGTDLRVKLADKHMWGGGSETMTSGIRCCVNMPTEEVFCPPCKYGTDGVVYASMPLVIGGNIIDKFMMRVENGRIVEVHAEQGEEVLKNAISLDEGASYFGEMALVPFDSPISNLGILFYNTLFDENASCHIAFGSAIAAFTDTPSVKKEDYEARGINDSLTHVDFMIGTADLSVIGVQHDGTEIPVFVDGNFAF